MADCDLPALIRKHLRTMPRYALRVSSSPEPRTVPAYMAVDVERAIDLALLELPRDEDAVDPSVTGTGNPTTREKSS